MCPNLIAEIFGDGVEQDKKAKILEKVRGLLAMADDAGVTPEEADLHRRKANELMLVYAVEQWELDQKKPGSERAKPEIRYVDVSWFYVGPYWSYLHTMFYSVAKHCRCVVARRGAGKEGHGYNEMPMIGIPSDLDWFDLLFTTVMLAFSNNLEPKPDANIPFSENCYRLRMSGMNRLRIAELLWKADMLPGIDTSEPFEQIAYVTAYTPRRGERTAKYSPIVKKALRMIRAESEVYAQEKGLDTTKVGTPEIWARSFADGFTYEIRRRLQDMASWRNQRPDDEGNHMALVLKDIYQMSLDMYEELWPAPPPPEPIKEEHGKSQRKRRVAMVKGPKSSGRGIQAGRDAAARVNLSNNPSERLGGNRKGLNE